jgi:hypothetical protein
MQMVIPAVENPTRNSSMVKPRLSADEVARFRDQGYLIYGHDVLAPAKFGSLRRHFEEMLSDLPEGVRPEEMDVPHFTDPALFEWLLDDDVLDLVEPLIGPDIALFSSHFLCKPAGHGKRVPWHEDSFYWKHMLEPIDVVTIWLAIDPSNRENGAMKVIPATHRNTRESEYEPVDPAVNVFANEIKRYQFDESTAVTFELLPNQASLHHSGMMHGSDPNTSNQRRCGYTMRYMSTRCRLHHETVGAWHHLYLARGKDHAGNVYGDPSRSYSHMIPYRQKNVRKGH